MGGGSKFKLFEMDLVKQMKGNYSLIPIAVCCAFGMGLSVFAIARTLLKSPDVSNNRRGNPHPYDYLEKDGSLKQYKYFSTMNYKDLTPDPDRPRFD